MTADEFNIKYKDYLEEGHYGLAIGDPAVVVEYLDSKFKEYIKIPGFQYSQIKTKFNFICFYSTLDSAETSIVQQKLKELVFGS